MATAISLDSRGYAFFFFFPFFFFFKKIEPKKGRNGALL
jgi:hypothetical protein